ncbi:hypothetical protein ACFYY2_02945 [Streptomyces sp. NPDC001822]|uniref:hypothetical protein n=1 Tax=Streptomyces sp. NPDC001822 TaxID=3364614 RepID=UPI0036B737B7
MSNEGTMDGSAAARQARFGQLPERMRYEDMVEAKPAEPGGRAGSSYNPEGSWNFFSCLAVDLGL